MTGDLRTALLGSTTVAPSSSALIKPVFLAEFPAWATGATTVQIEAQIANVLLQARETGSAFGLHLFAETAKAVCAEIDEKRTNNSEPDLAWNVPEILARFAQAAGKITMVHAIVRCDLNEAGYAHWASARATFGGEIVKLVGGLLVDAAARLERADELDEWLADLGDVVIAFVFPDWHGKAKSEQWKARQIEHFDSIRLALRERQGWLN